MAAASCCDELLSSIERYRARPRAGSAQGGKKQGGAYAKQDYWDQRFTKDDTGAFDWYVSYDELQAALEEHVPLRGDGMPHVLVVGCGNSSLSGSMYKAGYQRITNIDISEAVVRKMEQECSRPGMEWRAMDATAMEFEDARFDLAVEKGTVDALMSDGGVSADKATKLVAEVWRTLKPGGLLMLVSHSRWRGGLLDDALAAHCGADAAWEQVEARWNRLSDQATLINLIRAKLAPGQSFHEGFRDPVLLKAAGEETRKVIKLLLLMDLFRGRRRAKEKAQRAKELAEAGPEAASPLPAPSEQPPEEPTRHWDQDDVCGPDPSGKRQPFCYLYVVRKRLR